MFGIVRRERADELRAWTGTGGGGIDAAASVELGRVACAGRRNAPTTPTAIAARSARQARSQRGEVCDLAAKGTQGICRVALGWPPNPTAVGA
jgi:hypothetical protein